MMATCRKQLLNGTELLPANALGNRDWNRLVASCSNITINEEMDSIMATDCLNGTWFDNLGIINYNTLTKTYEEYRSDERRWVKRNEDNGNLILCLWSVWTFTTGMDGMGLTTPPELSLIATTTP